MEFGEIASIRTLPGRGIAFVNFCHAPCAQEAMRKVQGVNIRGHNARLSFAKVSTTKNTTPTPTFPSVPFFLNLNHSLPLNNHQKQKEKKGKEKKNPTA